MFGAFFYPSDHGATMEFSHFSCPSHSGLGGRLYNLQVATLCTAPTRSVTHNANSACSPLGRFNALGELMDLVLDPCDINPRDVVSVLLHFAATVSCL